MIIFPYYANVITPFEMTLNSKHRTEKLKTKDSETRKPNTERRKPSFTNYCNYALVSLKHNFIQL